MAAPSTSRRRHRTLPSRRLRSKWALAVPTAGVLVLVSAGRAPAGVPAGLAAAWPVPGGGAAHALALSGGAPAAPAGVTSSCVSALSNQVIVSWAAVARAHTYSVYDALLSPSGSYSLLASGVSGTSYTTPGLLAGTFYFEVAAVTGTQWQGPNSAASPGRVILAITCL